MLELCRTLRFCINDRPQPDGGDDARKLGDDSDTPQSNTFAAWPAMRGLGRYYEMQVCCRGQADPQTGYFINIKHIDQAARQGAIPLLHRAIASDAGGVAMGALLGSMLDALQPLLDHTVVSVQLNLTPTYNLTVEAHDMDHVLIRQRYEFSAAHRLHTPSLSDEQNREVFGKCNNPAGHGHNYELEIALRTAIDPHGHTPAAEHIDAIVDEHAIEHLDHKHLNHDVPQFAKLNPSVENIAQVIWQMLDGRFDSLAPAGGTLEEIRVWETGKTVCAYRGPAVTA